MTPMHAISPFFIVGNVANTVAFYRDRLGFAAAHLEPEHDPFFAIIRRDGVQIFLKSEAGVPSLPNPRRHPSMRWDAYVDVPDPDALAAAVRPSVLRSATPMTAFAVSG